MKRSQSNPKVDSSDGRPASEPPLSEEYTERCVSCQQSIRAKLLKRHRCTACRRLQAVSKSDAHMARILGEFPRLDHWPRWFMAETDELYIFRAQSFLRALILVVDKVELAVLHLATGSRFAFQLATVAPDQWDGFLR
ncbi:MAG: hypothetical protein R3E01_07860 [Pirellulaceae bacterium]|nr:hypothetical protein [Planctomycetales bacterium]